MPRFRGWGSPGRGLARGGHFSPRLSNGPGPVSEQQSNPQGLASVSLETSGARGGVRRRGSGASSGKDLQEGKPQVSLLWGALGPRAVGAGPQPAWLGMAHRWPC